jgi:O-antigen/teichoic acid export membrane protein
MVLRTEPADPTVRANEVAASKACPSNAVLTGSTLSSPSAEVDTASHSSDEIGSLDGPAKEVSSGLRWTVMRGVVVEGTNLLGVALLARLVAPAEFGRYAIALIVLLLSTVPTWAVSYTIVQSEDIDRDHLKTGQTLSILMGLAMCVLSFAAAQTIVPMLFGGRTAVLVLLMIPACFINSVNTVQYAILSRKLDFRRLSLLDMTIAVVSTVVSIPLAIAGFNGAAIVLGVDVASLAGFILICCWVLPPIPNFRRHVARDFARSGIPAASNAASLICFENCDYVIVGARVGALRAGYYFRAYTLGVVYQTKVSQVITTVGLPVMSRVRSEDEVHRLRQRIIQTTTMILFPLLTALAIVAPKFVTWFYGPAWEASVVPVQILAIGGAAMLVAQAVTVAMLSTGRPRAVALWGWGHFVVYGAAVFAVAHMGLPAVAMAAAIVHTTFLIISYLQLYRGSVRRAFKAAAEDLLPAAASCVPLAAVALPASMLATTLGIPILPYLIIVAVAGGTGYLLSLRLCFPNQLRDLGVFAARLLPARAHRMFRWAIVRPVPQSAAS